MRAAVAIVLCAAGTPPPAPAIEAPPIEPPAPAPEGPPVPPPSTIEIAEDEVVETPQGTTIRLAYMASGDDARSIRQVELEVEQASRKTQLSLGGREGAATRGWLGLRFTLLGADGGRARLTVEGTFAVPEPVRWSRDQRLLLAEGLDVTFRRHSHKHVEAGGPPSPLIIRYLHHRADGDHEEEARVEPEDDGHFEMGPYLLELVDHRYDHWMDLRVIGGP